MVIHHIARGLPSRQGVQIELRKFERPGDAAVDVVALLKVGVLEEVAANRPRGNGVAIHINASQLRDLALDRNQEFAKILVDCGTEGLLIHGQKFASPKIINNYRW